MLDFADVVAINKFERRGADDARRDVARQLVRNREAFGVDVGGHAGLRHQRRELQRRRRHRALPAAARRCWASKGWRVGRGRAARGATPQVSTGSAAPRPGRPRALPGRDRRDRPRLPPHGPSAGRAGPPPLGACGQAARGRCGRPATPRRAARPVLAEAEQALAARRAASCSTAGRAVVEDYSGRRAGRASSATRRLRTTLSRETLSGNPIPRVALPRYTDDGELRALPAHARTCPGTSRSPQGSSRSSGTARTRPGCSPARATRSAPTAASTCCPRASRPPGCRPRSTR